MSARKRKICFLCVFHTVKSKRATPENVNYELKILSLSIIISAIHTHTHLGVNLAWQRCVRRGAIGSLYSSRGVGSGEILCEQMVFT